MGTCRLISETIENIELTYVVGELNLYKILKQQNAGQLVYWKKLLDNGYIILLNAEFDRNNKNYLLTYKEAYVKKDDKELRIIQLILSDGNQQIVKNLFYDGLGRVIYVRNSDGTNKTINFDRRIITAYDENGHRKAYVLDGYDRISNVLEYNNNPILDSVLNVTSEEMYNTSYEYDTQDNLIKITDALGNKFTFSYDSIGGRIALSDPDLGNWTYEYDLVGNLVKQVQNGGGNLVTGDGYYREYDKILFGNEFYSLFNNKSKSLLD